MFARTALMLLFAGCSENGGALLVRITSSLQIPEETDRIVVRVLAETEPLEERSYPIGTPPRDAWPLIQQINRGKTSPDRITVAVELRKTVEADGALLLVGYHATDAEIPESGYETIDVEVARACDDDDGDEYGTGAGCKGFDCNDLEPEEQSCPERPDGGTDGGTGTCGQTVCSDGEVCVRADRCRRACSSREDCPAPFTCNLEQGACLCSGVPCRDDGPCALEGGRCIYGCCVFSR